MSVTSDGVSVVAALRGTLTVDCARDIWRDLTGLIARDESRISLNLSEVDRIDACILQLMLAFLRASGPERAFSVGELSAPVAETLTLSGVSFGQAT